MPHQKDGKNRLEFQMRIFMLNYLKKIINIKYSRSWLNTEKSPCGHQQPYNFIFGFCRFLETCGKLRKTKIGIFEAKELTVTGEKSFRSSQKEGFLEPIKKNLYIVNYWWAGVGNYVYNTILVITKIYIFLLYFTSVLLLIMRSQPVSIVWSVTSTATFYHCWSYTDHSDLWIWCVVYIWY